MNFIFSCATRYLTSERSFNILKNRNTLISILESTNVLFLATPLHVYFVESSE